MQTFVKVGKIQVVQQGEAVSHVGVMDALAVIGGAVEHGAQLYALIGKGAPRAVEPVEPVAYLDLSKLDKGGMAYATGFRTGDAQTALHPVEGATITMGEKNLGNYGALDAGPSVRRAYTHKYQPGNQAAASIGNAWFNARPGGDSIDAGLSLLHELEKAGYGVFAL